MFKNIIFILTTVLVIKWVFSLQLPSQFSTCSLSSKDVDDCLKKAVESAIRGLHDGNKEFEITPIDPLPVDGMQRDTKDGPIDLHQEYNNIFVKGFSTAEVLDFKINLDKCNFFMVVNFPAASIVANFEYKGQMYSTPIDSKGDLLWTLKNDKKTLNMACEIFKNNGEDYLRILDSKIEAVAEYEYLKYDKLVPDEKLNEELHQKLNENPSVLKDILKGAGDQLFAFVAMSAGNAIFTKVPLQEIFKK